MGSLSQNDNAWIYLATAEQLEAQILHLEALRHQHEGLLSALPLYGVPFAVKDNMDIAGWPTTAACPAFAYTAEADATVIANLKAKGAIVIGKTNLDQFATGLVGTRSPYGAVPNTFNPDYVSGGSSSGSASVLARGLVAFSLGTDTAGSGRVPAGFNNVVGLKPTKGWLSNTGVVPACRLNDSVSIFALTVADAQTVAQAAGGFDAADAYSRRNPFTAPVAMSPHPRFAVPDSLEFFGDALAEFEFDQALERLNSSGITLVPVDFTPFHELAEQLYYGAWVAERTAAVGEIFEESPEAMDPNVRGIVANGLNYTAIDAWRAEYLRAELSRKINLTLEGFDALVVPTSPTIRTQQELVQEPVLYNSQFGIIHQLHQSGGFVRAGTAFQPARRRPAHRYHADRSGLARRCTGKFWPSVAAQPESAARRNRPDDEIRRIHDLRAGQCCLRARCRGWRAPDRDAAEFSAHQPQRGTRRTNHDRCNLQTLRPRQHHAAKTGTGAGRRRQRDYRRTVGYPAGALW